MADAFIFADSLAVDQTTEQSYAYGPGATYPTPILIDAANEECAAYTSTTAAWSYNGALYKLLVGLTPHQAAVCKSTDSGATWAVLDAAGGPLSIRIGASFNEADALVYCAFRNEGNNKINLINFDLAAETWGSAYGTVGAPVMVAGVSAWKRPDNTILVAYQGVIGSGADAAAYDLTGGTWGAAFDFGANITLLPAYDGGQTTVDILRCAAVMGDAGAVHLFFQTVSFQAGPPFWGGRVFYQAIELDNSLGSFFDFPGQSTLTAGHQDLESFSGVPFGHPVIVNDIIVLPVLETNRNIDPFPHQLLNVYLGTPVSAPVWSTTMGATIDPGSLVDDFIWPQDTPFASFDGTTIYVVVACQDEDGQNFARLRLCQTTDLAAPDSGWAAFTAFDLQVDAPPGFNFPTQFLSLASIFAPVPAPPPVVVTPPVQAITGGLPFPVGWCKPRNQFDWCMFQEMLRMRKIKFPPLCSIPAEYRCRFPVPWGDDFGANAIPAQAAPLNRTGGIVTPATAAGDTLVIEERVPQGYDGLLQGVYWYYTGSGFDQGSGDIIWRVQLGQRFLEDLGAVTFQMGSPQSPMPLTEGQTLLSGQTVRVLVNVPNLSGMIQIGASRIAAGLIGFYWPR